MATASATKQFIELATPAAAEGARLPAAALLIAEKLPDSDPQKKVVVSYKQTYESKTGQPVSGFGGHMYDGLMILVGAMERSKSFDKAKVRNEIEKTKGFIGTGGVVNMTRGRSPGPRSYGLPSAGNPKRRLDAGAVAVTLPFRGG